MNLRNYGGGYGNQWAPQGPAQWAEPQQWGPQGCIVIVPSLCACAQKLNYSVELYIGYNY